MFRNVAAAVVVGLAGLIIILSVIERTPPTNAQAPGADAPSPATLAVTGSGEVAAEPDIGLIQVGVTTEAREATQALSANSARMTALFEALATRDIDDRDVQTSNFNISPIFSRPERSSQETPRVVGYRVDNQVSIKVRDLDAFGEILDELVSTGANTIQNIRFAVDEPQALLDEARTLAMGDARRKADLLAAAGGFRIGRILEVRENAGGPGPQFSRGFIAASAEAVPIASGELTFTATIFVSYEILED